jgi:NADH-ubiquinone oxidoreductase chain 5
LGANFECDLKKIIALSTLSQFGLITGAVSVGFVDFAFFHLLTHALFKALLFMCWCHYSYNEGFSGYRFMGNSLFQIPFTSVCLSVSSFALCGIPFLAGFYSKDLILEMVSYSYINLIGFFLFFCFYWLHCLLFILCHN